MPTPFRGCRSNALRKRKSRRAREAWQRRVLRRALQLWYAQAVAGAGLHNALQRVGQQQRAELLEAALGAWCEALGIVRRRKEQAGMWVAAPACLVVALAAPEPRQRCACD